MKFIDLNSDIGESFGQYKLGNDEEVVKYISSANIACGFHAGDPHVLRHTIEIAKTANTAVGAHPGLPDLIGFGRRTMDISPTELYDYFVYQIGAILAFCKVVGVSMQHVKCHGPIETMCDNCPELGDAIICAIKDVNPKLLFMTIANTKLHQQCLKSGLKVVAEAYADRAYNDDGTLVSRRLPGSIITDPEDISERIINLITTGNMVTYKGGQIDIDAQSICLHGDTPRAANLIKTIRKALEIEGIEIAPVGTFLK